MSSEVPALFSRRVAADLEENPLSRALAARRRAGLALLDLTASNPTRAGFVYEEARILAALAQPGALDYQPDPRGLRSARVAVSRYFAESRRSLVDPDRVLLTASTSEAYALLFKLLCEPGDVVLIPAPSYPLFGHLTALEGVRTLEYPLRWDGEWHIDLFALEELLGRAPRVRALLVVSPGNPTGAFLKPGEVARLEELCASRDIALISDEVFADYPSDPSAPPALCAADVSSALTFTLSGLSKVCALPQLKLAWCATTGPARLVDEAAARLELIADTYLSVGTPVQLALPELLETRHALQQQIRARCAANRARLAAVRPDDAGWDLLPSEGGWSAILRLPDARDEEALGLALLDAGLLVQPGYFYDFPRGNHLVLSLLPREGEFAQAAELLAELL